MPISNDYAQFGAQIEDESGVALTAENASWLADILKNRATIEPLLAQTKHESPIWLMRNGHTLHINRQKHMAYLDHDYIPLTVTEYDILVLLATNLDHTYTRDEILSFVHKDPSKLANNRTVDSHIKNLRRKLYDDKYAPIWIISAHGVGYCMPKH